MMFRDPYTQPYPPYPPLPTHPTPCPPPPPFPFPLLNVRGAFRSLMSHVPPSERQMPAEIGTLGFNSPINVFNTVLSHMKICLSPRFNAAADRKPSLFLTANLIYLYTVFCLQFGRLLAKKR